MLVPVSATVWGEIALGEQAGPALLPAAALVVASVMLVTDIRIPIRRLDPRIGIRWLTGGVPRWLSVR